MHRILIFNFAFDNVKLVSMKFTKEQFSEALKNRLSNEGKKKLSISDRTLEKAVERIYARLEKLNDESELENSVAEYLPDLEEIDGNIRNDNSAFIHDWKTKHPEDTTKPQGGNGGIEQGNDQLAALIAKVEAMERKQAEDEKQKTISDKRKELIAALKKEGVNADFCNDIVGKLNIGENTDIEAEKKDVVAIYNKIHSKAPKYQVPGEPGGGSGSEFDLKDLYIKKD